MRRLLSLSLILVAILTVSYSTSYAGNTDSAGDVYDSLVNEFNDESTPTPRPSNTPTPRRNILPTFKPTISPYIGTVEIVTSGYMHAYKSNDKKSGIVFNVHHGERFLCTGETDDGWYAIKFIDGTIGYVSQNDTSLERDVTDAQTFSIAKYSFWFTVKTSKKVTVYSQPKSSGGSRRESGDNSYTYFFYSGEELNCFGKTTHQDKEWYVLWVTGMGSNNTPEIVWVLASECVVVRGNPDANIIPDWWYD